MSSEPSAAKALRFGVYTAPVVDRGAFVFCSYRKRKVEVHSFRASDNWPVAVYRGDPGPIVMGDLVRALRIESAVEVATVWQVHRKTVSLWRRALSVGETEGDRARRREARRARQITPRMREALLQAAARPKPTAHRQRLAAAHRGRKKPHQALPMEKRIRLFFLARPGATDKEIAEALEIHPVTVAKYRSKASRSPRLDQAVRSLLKAHGREDLLEILGIAGLLDARALPWAEAIQAGKTVYAAGIIAGFSPKTSWKWARRLLAAFNVDIPRRRAVRRQDRPKDASAESGDADAAEAGLPFAS